MVTKEEYLDRIKKSKRYQKTLDKSERKRILKDAEKLWERRNLRRESNDEYCQGFLEGYYDAIVQILEAKDGDFDNPTKLRFFGAIGGGDFKGDMLTALGMSDKDAVKVAAIQYAMERGETFKEPFISGNGVYGHKDRQLYRQNGIFPGGRITSTIKYPVYSQVPVSNIGYSNGLPYTYTTYQSVKTGERSIPDSDRYLDMYKHLKPTDRQRVMEQYVKYKKKNSKKSKKRR